MFFCFKVNFEDDSRGKYLELLGYRKEDLGKKVNPFCLIKGGNLEDSDYISKVFIYSVFIFLLLAFIKFYTLSQTIQ